MANTHQVIFVAASVEQAHLLVNALRDEGIFAYVTNEALQMGDLHSQIGFSTAARVVVHESDADDARQIALEFEHAARHGLIDEDLAELEEYVDREEPPWPTCPSCRRRRHTSCPICGTAGTEFEPAFLLAQEHPGRAATADVPQRRLVLCSTCDEPFVPEHPARCEWCGYRFADGREEPASSRPLVTNEFNGRVWIVIVALVAVTIAILAFFASIVPES
jgi:hypothetical protein